MKNITERLKGDLRDYRPIPFWSWNDDLQPEELVRQIGVMRDKGIGGFFMHARGGLKTNISAKDGSSASRLALTKAKKST